VRKLFEGNEIKVGAIRMKHDGLKVFAFAETESVEMVEKAKAEMEGVEIQGRKLRVRSSKDTDKKRREERSSVSGRDDWRSEKKRRVEREPLKREDVTRHLVSAFVSFIERELGREGQDQTEEFKGLMEAAKTALNTAYNLQEDESLKVPRNIEDIFFRDVRNDIRIDRAEVKTEIKEEKEDGDGEEDDDGNWKRRGRGKDDDDENDNGEEDGGKDEIEDEKDSKEEEDEENLEETEKLEEAIDDVDEEEEVDDGNNDLENAIAKEEEENDGVDLK